MKNILSLLCIVTSLILVSCDRDDDRNRTQLTNAEKALALIDAFETGDVNALDYVSDDTYIQHNLTVPDGKEVLNGFINGTASGITTENVRVYSDGNIVIMQNIYGGVWNNGIPQVGFDIFRFSNGLIVEHWDNLAEQIDDSDGTSQTNGNTTISDLDQTGANRTFLSTMANDLFVQGDWPNKLRDYFNVDTYVQHSVGAGTDASFLEFLESQPGPSPFYTSIEFVYAEGNFGITLSQGPDITGQDPDGTYAYYDLFRIENGLIVEHWDVIQLIPPTDEWANTNGKW